MTNLEKLAQELLTMYLDGELESRLNLKKIFKELDKELKTRSKRRSEITKFMQIMGMPAITIKKKRRA